MIKRYIVTIMVCCIFAGAAYPKELKLDLTARTPANMALRSLILPGWGSYANGKKTKGYIIAGSVVLTGAAAFVMHENANKTYDKYTERGAVNDELYSEYETQYDSANVLSLAAAVIWIYGIMAAYGDATGYGYDDEEGKRKEEGIDISCDKNSMYAAFTKRF